MPVAADTSAEVAAAWKAYLEATVGVAGPSYEEVEPHAWKVLQHRLAKIKSAV
jgi:hypothetical protein